MTNISTIGGVPTRGEAYSKMLHHLREAEDQMYVISHLHNTEDNPVDKGMAKLWQMAGERVALMIKQLTILAQGNLQ